MKTKRLLLILLVLSIATGIVCDYVYHLSPQKASNTTQFQKVLHEKEQIAQQTLQELKNRIQKQAVDSLIFYAFPPNDISYFIFENGELIFWSDNNLEINSYKVLSTTKWQYNEFPNAFCTSRVENFKTYQVLAVIKIKNNYLYENEDLVNEFSADFHTNAKVKMSLGKPSDAQAIFSSDKEYLFSLVQPEEALYNAFWQNLAMLAYALAFLLFFILYAILPTVFGKKILSIAKFLIAVCSVGVLLSLALYFNVPSSLFLNEYFTPFQYAANPLLTSIIHLSVLTAYFISTLFLFNSYTLVRKTLVYEISSKIALSFLFLIFYFLLRGLVFHSSIQLSILSFNDFSFVTVGVYLLLFIWGAGLLLFYVKTYTSNNARKIAKTSVWTSLLSISLVGGIGLIAIPENTLRITGFYMAFLVLGHIALIHTTKSKTYLFVSIAVLLFTSFVVGNILLLTNTNKQEKYNLLAQNISINGNIENDRMAEIMLEELDGDISNDLRINALLASPDSISAANEYINRTYLRGFWNKYEMRLNVATHQSELWMMYKNIIERDGFKLRNTHFYTMASSDTKLTYLGVFPVSKTNPDSVRYMMEFYPRKQFKSYSFPNLLIASSPDIQSKRDITVAKYTDGKLVYASPDSNYPSTTDWFLKSKTNHGYFHQHWYSIYSPSPNNYIVLSEKETKEPYGYILYFVYTFLAFLALSWLLVWIYNIRANENSFHLGLTTKFQYAFILLLIISFIGIFYVSVNFIRKKYTDQQIENIENKKNYIQKSLQELYYWNQSLSAENTQDLNFDLQDLSYTFQTDIHVYDNNGVLIGSSQPTIFSKSLISNRMSPEPYFNNNAPSTQYEHIGKLNYLTAYTDLYNGDYLQIGYIAIPQFLSQDEIRSEIESFISVIVHIYIIIIVLAIFLTIFIGKQLSAPLKMLENKLKEMRLGRKNEKIEYQLNDEIGQLVIQYNKTIDELDKSAKLLAQSERESAWKSMARQVAHEINNPLTPMKLTIQQLQRTKKMSSEQFDGYFEKSSEMLIEQIDNLSRIAGTFSNFARMPEAQFERVDIAAKLYSVVQLFENNNENTQLIYKGKKKSLYAFADPEQLVQVFNNLLKNAIQAIPSDKEGKININIESKEDTLLIHITDNGTGIAPDIQDKLFAPNFTTKTTGMGLGLAISKNIIELTGGSITFSSRLNVGTTFTLALPKEN